MTRPGQDTRVPVAGEMSVGTLPPATRSPTTSSPAAPAAHPTTPPCEPHPSGSGNYGNARPGQCSGCGPTPKPSNATW